MVGVTSVKKMSVADCVKPGTGFQSIEVLNLTVDGTLTASVPPANVVSACTVYLASNQSVGTSATATIIFGTKVFDLGENYNVSTGVFTCPLKGIYSVSVRVAALTGAGGTSDVMGVSVAGSAFAATDSKTVASSKNGYSLDLLLEGMVGTTIIATYANSDGSNAASVQGQALPMVSFMSIAYLGPNAT